MVFIYFSKQICFENIDDNLSGNGADGFHGQSLDNRQLDYAIM